MTMKPRTVQVSEQRLYSQRDGNLLNMGKVCLLLTVGLKDYSLIHHLKINGTVYGHLTFILRAENGPP